MEKPSCLLVRWIKEVLCLRVYTDERLVAARSKVILSGGVQNSRLPPQHLASVSRTAAPPTKTSMYGSTTAMLSVVLVCVRGGGVIEPRAWPPSFDWPGSSFSANETCIWTLFVSTHAWDRISVFVRRWPNETADSHHSFEKFCRWYRRKSNDR